MRFLASNLDGVLLTTVQSASNLGVIFDANLIMEAQITRVAQLTFFHLRQAGLLVPYLAPEYLATVIHATVTSRLDYCNSLYTGLPLSLL